MPGHSGKRWMNQNLKLPVVKCETSAFPLAVVLSSPALRTRKDGRHCSCIASSGLLGPPEEHQNQWHC